MNNKTIIQAIKTTASLLELHDENAFKVKSYQGAVFNLEKYPDELFTASPAALANIKGVGKSIAENILDIQKTGSFPLYQELISKTPSGVLELLQIKGLGAKKIRILWQDLGIENKSQLIEAIDNDKLVSLKGFGKKTQDNLKKSLSYEEENKGKILFSQAEAFANQFIELIKKEIPDAEIKITGQVRRKLEVITEIRFLLLDTAKNDLYDLISHFDILTEEPCSSPFNWRYKTKEQELPVTFTFCKKENLQKMLFLTTGTPEHLAHKIEGRTLRSHSEEDEIENENGFYEKAGLPFYIPELREGHIEFSLSKEDLESIITTKDLKGILHNHTTYSDGKNSILEMAKYCQELGCEYLGINDHSKSAYFYANGMYEEQVYKQQEEIQKLNKEVAPFKIFKGIEVDILQDGSLDYTDDVLDTFDFTVASIHSAFNMDKIKATERVIKAVSNPYTTILGHMSGRLFLRREGYPLDYEAIIDACADNEVIIELNANPYRLDMDWRWIRKAVDKGVMISINPDAHVKEGLTDIYYGVCAARKAGLSKIMTFNTRSAAEVDKYFRERKERALKR